VQDYIFTNQSELSLFMIVVVVNKPCMLTGPPQRVCRIDWN